MTALIALNPYLIWAATEIRLYAFAILLSALLIVFFYDGYLAETPTRKARWYYFLLAIAGLYTHFFLAFVLVGNAVALLSLKRWRAFQSYFAFTAIAGLCFMPLFLLLIAELPSRMEAYSAPVPLTRSLTFIATCITNFIIYIWRDSTLISKVLRFFLAIALTVFCTILIKRNRSYVHANFIAVWATTGSIALLLSIFLTVTRTSFLPRYAYPLFIPSILSMFSILSSCKLTARIRGLKIWTGIAFCTFGLSLFMTYLPLAKTGDWSRVASYLTAVEKSNQPILVFNAEVKMMLHHYYPGLNQLIPIPKEQNFARFNPADFRINSEQEVANTFSSISGKHQVFWFVSNDEHCTDQEMEMEMRSKKLNDENNCQYLKNFINKYYFVSSTKQFYDSYVQMLVKKN